jgi:hypothetical protein
MTSELNTPKLESRRLSRGLSSHNLNENQNNRLSEISNGGARPSVGKTTEALFGSLPSNAPKTPIEGRRERTLSSGRMTTKSGMLMARINKQSIKGNVTDDDAAYFLAMSDQTKKIMEQLGG